MGGPFWESSNKDPNVLESFFGPLIFGNLHLMENDARHQEVVGIATLQDQPGKPKTPFVAGCCQARCRIRGEPTEKRVLGFAGSC